MVKIHPEGKIIDCKYKSTTTESILRGLERSDVLDENKHLIGRFVRDARLGKTIKGRAKKKVGALRQAKYVQDLKKLDDFLKKPLDKVTEKDMEKFILALEEGTICKTNNQPYAKETQIAIKNIVIKFYKWLNGGKTPPTASDT